MGRGPEEGCQERDPSQHPGTSQGVGHRGRVQGARAAGWQWQPCHTARAARGSQRNQQISHLAGACLKVQLASGVHPWLRGNASAQHPVTPAVSATRAAAAAQRVTPLIPGTCCSPRTTDRSSGHFCRQIFWRTFATSFLPDQTGALYDTACEKLKKSEAT